MKVLVMTLGASRRGLAVVMAFTRVLHALLFLTDYFRININVEQRM